MSAYKNLPRGRHIVEVLKEQKDILDGVLKVFASHFLYDEVVIGKKVANNLEDCADLIDDAYGELSDIIQDTIQYINRSF